MTPTTTINLDNRTILVSSCTPEVQQMVKYIDDWREQETALTSKLLMAKSALRDMQKQLVVALTTPTQPLGEHDDTN